MAQEENPAKLHGGKFRTDKEKCLFSSLVWLLTKIALKENQRIPWPRKLSMTTGHNIYNGASRPRGNMLLFEYQLWGWTLEEVDCFRSCFMGLSEAAGWPLG